MKKHNVIKVGILSSFLLFFSIILVQSCRKADNILTDLDKNFINSFEVNQDQKFLIGDVEIISNFDEIIVLVKVSEKYSEHKVNSIEKVFILQHGSLHDLDVSYKDVRIYFNKKEGILMIPQKGEAHYIGLGEGGIPTTFYNFITSELKIANVKSFLGFGIGIFNGLWDISKTDIIGSNDIRLKLSEASRIKREALSKADELEGPDPKCTNCDAGGIGAISCSIYTYCSTTCGSGFFACCKSNANYSSCKCCPNPSN